MTVRDTYAESQEHHANGGYRAPWLPRPIPINKVATENGGKRESRLIFFRTRLMFWFWF